MSQSHICRFTAAATTIRCQGRKFQSCTTICCHRLAAEAENGKVSDYDFYRLFHYLFDDEGNELGWVEPRAEKLDENYKELQQQWLESQGSQLEEGPLKPTPEEENAMFVQAGGGYNRNRAYGLGPSAYKKPSRLVKPVAPANFVESKRERIRKAINSIFLKCPDDPDSCDLEILYQDMQALCLLNMGGSLYQLIEKECEPHIATALGSLVGQIEDFLSLVGRCWQDFCDKMLKLRGVATYLDTTYVRCTPNLLPLWNMGMQLFRKHLSLASQVENKLVSGLIQMIESERLGEEVDRTLLNKLMKMVKELNMYVESFEKPFHERTSVFYAAEGVKYMQLLDVPDYLKHVEARLNEEKERWCLLTQETSTRISIVERQLLESHISAILEKGFTALMDGNCIEDLRRMYVLFGRVNALESLKQALSSYIHRARKSIVLLDKEKDKEMVSILLELKYASLETILAESFCENEAFSRVVRDAFGCL